MSDQWPWLFCHCLLCLSIWVGASAQSCSFNMVVPVFVLSHCALKHVEIWGSAYLWCKPICTSSQTTCMTAVRDVCIKPVWRRNRYWDVPKSATWKRNKYGKIRDSLCGTRVPECMARFTQENIAKCCKDTISSHEVPFLGFWLYGRTVCHQPMKCRFSRFFMPPSLPFLSTWFDF